MSDEWNWGQEPEKTDGSSQQPENTDESGSAASDQTAAPEDELNENVTYHYKYTSSRNSDGAGSTDNGNYYASSNNSDTSGNSSKDSGFESQSSEPRYAHYQVDEQEKKPEEKKKGRHHRLHNDKAASSGFGRKAGNTITLAVIFGLVAGLVFQAVNMVSDKYFKKETQTAVGSAETLTSSASASTTAEESTDAGEGINAEIVANEKGPVAGVAQAAMPSVVAITSVSMQEIRSFFGYGMEYPSTGSGSGIIVGENDDELLIATNNHVVEGATTLSVCFIGSDVVSAEQETENYINGNGDLNIDGAVSAKIKGTDEDTDLAVIAVEKSDIPEETMSQIKIAQLGNSDDLAVGEQVVAIGNALGYGQSVTTGVISALNRKIDSSNSEEGTSLIQTDAAINPGNSGGALLNMRGEVIGINSNKIGGSSIEGMGYAIPISTARPIIEDLMERQTRTKYSEEERGYLGISCINVTSDLSENFSMPQGIFVAQVYSGTGAEAAGLVRGNIVVAFDGVTVKNQEELTKQMQYYKAGESVEITIMVNSANGYQQKNVTVTLSSYDQINAASKAAQESKQR